MLEKYYTFIIVRDPIERILSAYKDKAFDEFRGGLGRRVYSFLQVSQINRTIRVTFYKDPLVSRLVEKSKLKHHKFVEL